MFFFFTFLFLFALADLRPGPSSPSSVAVWQTEQLVTSQLGQETNEPS
jgi:hypothetical protein